LKVISLHSSFQLNGEQFSCPKEVIHYGFGISDGYGDFLEEWFSDRIYLTVKTSGSTGKPKKIRLQKEHVINSALATGDFFKLTSETSALCCLPIQYIAGKMMLVRALVLGWHLDVISPSSTPLNHIDKEFDFSAMIPLQVSNSLVKIHLIKKVLVGGGIVSSKLAESLQRVSSQVFASYGMTETITHIAIQKLNHPNNPELGSESFFKTLPHVKISQDLRNCLVIDAPKISFGRIVTNDIVEIISETTFRWIGRYDHIINSGGIKLSPEEIESKLFYKLKGRFFVAGIRDRELGEKLILLIEGQKYSLNERVFSELSKFEIPKKVFFIPKFVETATGKVQRSKTLDLLMNRDANS